MVGIRRFRTRGGDIIQRLLDRVVGVDILGRVAFLVGPIAIKRLVGPLPVVGVERHQLQRLF